MLLYISKNVEINIVEVNMLLYSKDEGFIKFRGIKNKDGIHDSSIVLPHIAVGVFSEHLLNDIVEKYRCEKVGELTEKRPVYSIKYKDTIITLFMAGISGSWLSGDIEDMSVNGVDTFVIFGNCGVLDNKIEDCSIIIPNKAFRDEGISYHYLPDSESLDLDRQYTELFKKILKEYNFDYTEGATWTIDAFYRETSEKIKMFKNKGAVCVEMEGASLAAVCKYKNLNYFTFYYAGDNLDSVEWEERSIDQLTNFDKKTQVPVLALELAHRIDKQK